LQLAWGAGYWRSLKPDQDWADRSGLIRRTLTRRYLRWADQEIVLR
jgi:hypothetical protein